MSSPPVVAIVGSARAEITGDRESDARAACVELGRELARKGLRIFVYTSQPDFIEADVVKGFVEGGGAGPKSIVWPYPHGADAGFKDLEGHPELLDERADPEELWEVSFYRSILSADGVILLGGGPSTVVVGHVALANSLPILAVAEFGGGAKQIWEHLAAEPAYVQADDVRAMATWRDDSARRCVESITAQIARRDEELGREAQARAQLEAAARELEEVKEKTGSETRRLWRALLFVLAFLALLIGGISLTRTGTPYTIVLILGLCSAGGLGATVRMLTPGAPPSRRWIEAVLGVVVGLVLSLLYLIPQLIGDSSFLTPDTEVGGAMKVQYVAAMLVAFMAGLGFDFALDQLLQRSRQRGQEIIDASP